MTRDHVTIRRARLSDVADLANLAARSFRDTFAKDNDPDDIEAYLHSSFTEDRVRSEFDNANTIFLIACPVDENVALGYAKLCTSSHDPSVPDQNTIEIERLYADKPAIGRGVGAALMRQCLSEAAGFECDSIWLGVWERNERAIDFYQRWGFEIVGSRQFTLGSDVQSDLIMTLNLS